MGKGWRRLLAVMVVLVALASSMAPAWRISGATDPRLPGDNQRASRRTSAPAGTTTSRSSPTATILPARTTSVPRG